MAIKEAWTERIYEDFEVAISIAIQSVVLWLRRIISGLRS
jgi:hypothetical protein